MSSLLKLLRAPLARRSSFLVCHPPVLPPSLSSYGSAFSSYGSSGSPSYCSAFSSYGTMAMLGLPPPPVAKGGEAIARAFQETGACVEDAAGHPIKVHIPEHNQMLLPKGMTLEKGYWNCRGTFVAWKFEPCKQNGASCFACVSIKANKNCKRCNIYFSDGVFTADSTCWWCKMLDPEFDEWHCECAAAVEKILKHTLCELSVLKRPPGDPVYLLQTSRTRQQLLEDRRAGGTTTHCHMAPTLDCEEAPWTSWSGGSSMRRSPSLPAALPALMPVAPQPLMGAWRDGQAALNLSRARASWAGLG